MKLNINFFICAVILASTLFSCNDDFLERYPISSQTVETTFTTYDNFKVYSWGIYSRFFLNTAAYSDAIGGQVFSYPGTYDREGDDAMFTSGGQPAWAWQKYTKASFNESWDFSLIRQVNIMLDNIDKSSMNQQDKDHWRAVGYFFRAWRYSQLILNYGDVPWLEHVVQTIDNDIIYGPRTPRNEVSQNILDNLLWAETHIKPDGEGVGSNSVNVHVVRALISRFGLVEGTWRKYHKLGDHEKYLNECIRASKLVMDANPSVNGEYDAIFNRESLKGVQGMLIYRAFEPLQLYHNVSRYERTSAANTEMTADGVACYLTRNGLPVKNAANQSVNKGKDGKYAGENNVFDEFRNRDYRLYHTVTPPYRVKGLVNSQTVLAPYLTTKDTYGSSNKPVTADDSIMFVENIELMKTVASKYRTGVTGGIQFPVGITYTSLLPVRNWEGNAVMGFPHINSFSENRGFCVTRGGYYVYKYYNTSTAPNGQVSSNDIPLMRVEETMLNYAEAMWEMSKFDQGVADITINKLRPRAGVASMVVANIDANFDPDRDKGGYVDSKDPNPIADYAVDPVLWEIRRERRVELMGDGFRFGDLKRWRKGHYLNKVQLGAPVDNTDYNNTLAIYPYDTDEGHKTTASNGKKGRIVMAGDPVGFAGKGWKWYYYYLAIPPTQIQLNPELVQNPGWDND